MIAKAEFTNSKRNPRFVVTSLPVNSTKEAQRIYEDTYCARGDMENRIKEQQNYLFADRTSAEALGPVAVATSAAMALTWATVRALVSRRVS